MVGTVLSTVKLTVTLARFPTVSFAKTMSVTFSVVVMFSLLFQVASQSG